MRVVALLVTAALAVAGLHPPAVVADPRAAPSASVEAGPASLRVVEVLAGDLIRLRRGTGRRFTVRLLGVRLPKADACVVNGARRYLRSQAKPGQVVTLVADHRAPRRDRKGRLIAEVKPEHRPEKWFGYGADVVFAGWAEVAAYRFRTRRELRSYRASADASRRGAFGTCLRDYGSSRHPYRAGTRFEFDGWRYEFGLTDLDALPEMTAEQAALPPGTVTFTPPAPGATFRRVAVTATRLDESAAPPDQVLFKHLYGDTLTRLGASRHGSCGRAPNLLIQMTVQPGQTVTGHLCTARPASDGSLEELWVVEDVEHGWRRYVSTR